MNCLYDQNVQLRLEAMAPKGHRVLVTMHDIPLNKYFSWGLLRAPVGAEKLKIVMNSDVQHPFWGSHRSPQ